MSDLLKWTFFSPLLNVLLREGREREREKRPVMGHVSGGEEMREEASSLQVTFFPTYAALVSPYAITAFLKGDS